MDEEEDKAKRVAAYVIGQDLSELSIEEISELTEALKAELKRLETTKLEKNEHLIAAAKMFKI